MTRPLGEGLPSPGPPFAMSRRHVPPAAAGREAAQECRNQKITEFFKPVLSQDRTVLSSPDKGNIKEEGMGLSVLRTEGFERNVSSPQKVRRKSQTKHQVSPVVGVFWKRIEEEDSVNMSENGRVCRALGSLYPKVVIWKLLVTAGSRMCSLTKRNKTAKPEQGRNETFLGVRRASLSYGNSWEEENDCMDLTGSSSDSDKWVSPREADAWKAWAGNNGTASITPLCSSQVSPLPCSPTHSAFRLSLEDLCREREWEKQKLKQPKPRPVKPFKGTNVLHQMHLKKLLKGNGCPIRKIMSFGSREIASDDPSQPKLTQVLELEASSPQALRASSEMASGAPESPAVPSHFFKMSFGLSKPRDCPGKRKHTAMSGDGDSSDQSEVDEPAFSISSSKCKNRRCDSVKSVFLKSPHDDVLQLKDPAGLPRHDWTLSEEFLNSSNEKEKNNYSTVGLSSSYSAHSPAKNNHISVVDTKENQLQLANSCVFFEKSLPFSQEKSTVLPSPHHLTQAKGMKSPLQVAGLSQVLDAKKEQDKRPERHERNKGYSIQPSNSFSITNHEISENTPGSCRMEIPEKLGLSPEIGESVPPSLPLEESSMDSDHESSQTSGELEVKRNFTHKPKPNRKWQSSSESEDDIMEPIVEDNDEEVLMPLQKMLSSSLKPEARALEDSSDSVSEDTVTPLLKLHLSRTPVASKVSYVNSLDHLLKEKEESRRLEEIEKRLQEDIERENNASDGENEDSASGDDLSEEHRAFIKRFSVVSYVIPDKHPGESIFDLSAAGKIFTQHNLDLRNFHFTPQNHTECLLLNCGVTQQLFLVVNGVLNSTYRHIMYSIPILKWLFQMMSIHPDHCVSTKILSRLMEITLKNSSICDEQFKPWIPSIADISAVFVNMGIGFRSLFPLQHLQPTFNEHDILSQVQETVSQQQPRGDVAFASPVSPSLLENNLINVIKFLAFCTSVFHDGYTDREIWLLLILLFKISLEKQLKQDSVIDFQCLFVKLLMNIKDWDTKMPELCLAVSELSSNHHNLLWLVQLVPSWITRGREVRRRLSLVIISKLLHKKHVEISDDIDKQMFLLHQFLVCMKPSYLLKKMREMRKGRKEHKDDEVHAELEHEVYYLVYVLLHLVSEASYLDVVNSSRRQHLLKLCRALDKHIKGDIREDARMFYRSKVKGLAARIYGKWQDVIQTTRLTQGKLHDFWEPD